MPTQQLLGLLHLPERAPGCVFRMSFQSFKFSVSSSLPWEWGEACVALMGKSGLQLWNA